MLESLYLIFRETADTPQRIRQLILAQSLHVSTELSHDRHCRKSRKPFPVFLHLRRYDPLRSRNVFAPLVEICQRRRPQVVEIVQKDILQRSNIWLHVARKRDVENAERTVTPRAQ